MFTQVRLANFKSFPDADEISLRQISVLIGPNGSGKSSVLQALLIWKQSGERPSLDPVGTFDFGQPSGLRHHRGFPSRLGITVTSSLSMPALTGSDNPVSVAIDMDANVGSPTEYEYRISSQSFNVCYREGAGNIPVEPPRYEAQGSYLRFNPSGLVSHGIEVNDRGGDNWQAMNREFDLLASMPPTSLNGVRYVLPLRGFSLPQYNLRSDLLQDFGSNPRADQNADALATGLVYNHELLGLISNTVQHLTGVGLDQRLRPQMMVSPVSLRQGTSGETRDVTVLNEGFGTNQLVHLLAQTFSAPDGGGTVLIEEPELHLHPAVQVRLGIWIAAHAIDHKKQFLITTHSEHFLAGLLWQVRQEAIAPSDIAVHYFALDDTVKSIHRRLDVTHGGLITGSFREFFSGSDIPEWQEFFRGLQG